MWLFNSSIGRKFVMSLSGFFLVFFLLFHSSVNLVAVFSESGYNSIGHFLGTNPVVALMVPILALGFVIHIIYATVLTVQNRRARGNDRYAKSANVGVQWASKNMFVLGVVVLGALGWHLSHFWAKMQLYEWTGRPSEEGFALIQVTFSDPIIVVCYIVWFVAIWFHLTHGFWSMFQSIGFSNDIWYKRLKNLGIVVATIICLMFTFVAVAFYLNSIGAWDSVGHLWTIGAH
ncbi:succinate dehydrogenase [Porphyromonas sp.]|uniref:succinate dehydrogenase n=1 Tax=Porphyromonas sp. TaxID=1924944 RepID=UPI0026DCD8F2|nr:succinate dehydrogenase [Porphyromonas sp.]MDO4695683.1 succinate dehydrogenase [Porphyromonas sp.]MDO4771493.1 succinate dehydrogenase [Porphyromonas sp.]